MRSDTTGRYEMLWDCPSCGTEKLLGLTHRHCPNCGSPQDPTRRYFPPEGEQIAVGDHPYQGVDVKCAGCDTPNAAKAHFCVSCGAPLEGATAVGTRAEQTAAGTFAADAAADAAREAEEARQKAREEAMAGHAASSGAGPKAAPPPKPKGKGSGAAKAGIGLFVLVAVLLVMAVACGVFLFWKKDTSLAVQGHLWERTIAVETYAPKQGSGWRDAVPAAAYDVSCQRAERDTKKVPDGETCVNKRQDKGDGSFETKKECTPTYREEPIYDDKCSYTLDSWVVTRTEKATGSGLAPAPTWPAVSIGRPGTCRGCEREGARKESYTIQMWDESEKKTLTCTRSEPDWRAMTDGTRWKGTVGVLSGALDCSALQPL